MNLNPSRGWAYAVDIVHYSYTDDYPDAKVADILTLKSDWLLLNA
jgi:hypothetical protein